MASLEILSQEKDKMSVKINGVPIQYANALRRICLNGIPIFAIDTVDIIENSSVLADEGLAHRLGMVPLKTDLERFVEPSHCECQKETGCSNCRVMLVLDSGKTDNTRTVLSEELSSEDEVVKPVSDQIPIVELAPGQKIKVEAFARLGRGMEHAKWNSSNVAVLLNTDKEDEHILTVETTGALNPSQIILKGIEELSNRLEGFKLNISSVKS